MRSGAKLIHTSSNISGTLYQIENYVGLRIESNSITEPICPHFIRYHNAVSMLKLKYENLGKIPSIVGTALHSAQDGDIVQILARWSLLNMKEFTDEYITVVKGQINSMLVEWVYPRLLQMFSTKSVPEDFLLHAVYIEMHADEKKNRILINEDTKFYIGCRIKAGITLQQDDPVKIGDIEEFVSLEKKQDIDPNAAIIMLALNKNGWFGKADLVYNRENTREKINRAISFFNAAHDSLNTSNMPAFYQSLWDCAELLAESVLLLHNQIKLKATHDTIQKTFEQFCKHYNIKYIDDYKKISQIRNNARYGPPHPSYKKWITDAPVLFQNIFEMQQFVLSFLRDREVTPSQPHTKLDPSKRKFSA